MANAVRKAVISYPFSGALYAFFEEQLNEYRTEPVAPRSRHPYYRTLYGDHFPEFQELALTLTMLFDEIVLAPADAHIPRDEDLERDEIQYKNLGLVSSWDFDIRHGFKESIEHDLKDPVIKAILRRVPRQARRHILEDTRHEIVLAAKHSCPIVCFGGRRAIVERILKRDAQERDIYNNVSLMFAEQYLDIVGIIFNPRDFEILCELKQSREMRLYAQSFLSAMDSSSDRRPTRREMLIAMKHAIESRNLAGRVTGVLDGASKILTVSGLIPVVGTFTGLGSLATDGGSSLIQHLAQKHDWVEFGPQVKRLSSLSAIDKLIDHELSSVS